MPDEPSNWDRATLTEKRATMLIWEADDQELALLIHIITEHEQQYARTMTVHELRERLKRPAW